MARLTIEQVNAPDFSASSEMLARANQSFNSGMESAKGILSSYQEGQQKKADDEVFGLLARADSPEALQEILNSDLLLNRSNSQTMRDWIGGLRTELFGNEVRRAGIDSTRAATSRANAAEGREASEWNRGQAQDAWLRRNAGSYLEAERNALTGGTAFSNHIDRTESGGGADQYDTLFGHRNRKNGVQVSEMTIGQAAEFASPNGQYGQSVNAEIGRVATPMGKFQIVGSTLRRLQEDLQLPDDLPFSPAVQEQLGLYLAQQRIFGPRTREAQRSGMRSEWEGFKNVSNPELDVMIDEIRSMPPVNRDTILAAAYGSVPQGPARTSQGGPRQTTPTGFGGDDWAAFMAASGLFRPDQVLGQVAPLREAEALRQAELIAEATRTAILDPNNLSGTAVQRDLLTTPGLSFGNMIAAAGQDLGKFAGVISPTVAPDDEVNAALERANAADATRAGEDPLSRSFALADTFRTSEDLGRTLMGQVDLPSDTSLDSGYVNSRVTFLADAAGVTPGEMASVISELAQGHGGMFQEIINAPADDDLYRSMISLAQNRFSAKNRDAYDRSQRERKATEAQRSAAQIAYDVARTRALKFPVGSPQRTAIEREANTLRETVLAGRTPREREQNLRDYIARTNMPLRLTGLKPGSTAHTEALVDLIEWIKVDPTLTQTEKELLLADIQG